MAQLGQDQLYKIAIERAVTTYREKRHSEEWITQRLQDIQIRKDLSAEWDRYGVKKRK